MVSNSTGSHDFAVPLLATLAVSCLFQGWRPNSYPLGQSQSKVGGDDFLTMRPDLYVISCHINKILSCRHRCQGGLWELIYDIMVI